jgi:hypothetical protein
VGSFVAAASAVGVEVAASAGACAASGAAGSAAVAQAVASNNGIKTTNTRCFIFFPSSLLDDLAVSQDLASK